jgi:hypothetical protein
MNLVKFNPATGQVQTAGTPGGATAGAAGCDYSDIFPSQPVGGPAFTRQYDYMNNTDFPLAIVSVVLTSDTPERWTIDPSGMEPSIPARKAGHFLLTFTPPAK